MSAPPSAAIAFGKLAVVTGGAGGIGLAAARAFAEAGMKVVLIDRQDEAIGNAAASIDGVAALPGDVANRGAVDELARAARSSPPRRAGPPSAKI